MLKPRCHGLGSNLTECLACKESVGGSGVWCCQQLGLAHPGKGARGAGCLWPAAPREQAGPGRLAGSCLDPGLPRQLTMVPGHPRMANL